jgi:hypothetical protein
MDTYEQDLMNYGRIKQLAKASGRQVKDFIVLAPQNDPFYVGTPGDMELGQWFAALWQAFGYGSNVHIRRVHYQIISQNPPVSLPNGLPYENTENCWNVLNMASKAARYLGLVNPSAFDDRRNPDPVTFAEHQHYAPKVGTMRNLWLSDVQFPAFPDLPKYRIDGYGADQAYHLEIWCEKSTMNDVLVPLCQQYGANLQTGLGELSITATLALVNRLQQANKPARILYVSDFDPAGQSMPVAVSRKIEYFVRSLGLELDIRVFPVILTQEQVQYYQLPRTPIKETERRREAFEDRHGSGAVELDALEALYPGTLVSILRHYLDAYYDHSLSERVQETRAELEQQLSLIWQQVTSHYALELEALRVEHGQLKKEFEAKMVGYADRIQRLWQAIHQDLGRAIPDLAPYTPPLPYIQEEIGEGLYDSARDYMEQVEVYKLFQGRL